MSPTLCCDTRAHICSLVLLPTNGIRISFFSPVGPGPLHEIAVSAFCVAHWAVQKQFPSTMPPQPPAPSTPRTPLSASPLQLIPYEHLTFPSFNCPFLFLQVLYPPNFSIGSTSSWSPPISSHIFLDDVIPSLVPARPFVIFSHTAIISNGRWQPLFWHILLTF